MCAELLGYTEIQLPMFATHGHNSMQALRLSLVALCFLALPTGADPRVAVLERDVIAATGAPDQVAAADGKPRPQAATARPSLTTDLIYAVLVAQVAEQRGDQQMAFTHFLHGAQLSKDPALAERAARAALALGKPEPIERAVTTWLEIAPHSMTAHQIAAFVRLQNDDVDGAMHHLRQLVNLAPDDGERGFMQAARLVHKLRPPERRLELMEHLTDGDPENADAWFARALVAAGAERRADAARAARRATELRPEWSEPRIFLVQVLQDMGRSAEARETLERFVAEDPNDNSLRMLYAQLLIDEREYAAARGIFERVLQDDPNEADVLFALGILSLQLEDLGPARDYFTRLRNTGERWDDAAYYLGQVEELDGASDLAASWYAKVRGEHALDAKVRIARLRAEGGDLDEAREMLDQLRDQWKEDGLLIYMLEAEMLADLDRAQEALSVYGEALEAFPDNLDLRYARALHAAGMQQLEVLERDLRFVLEKDPDHADALNALGYTLADQTDRYQEALGLIEKALALKPDDPAVLDSMGWVQYRLGNLEEAERYLRQALERLQDGEIAAHLGEVLWAKGQKDAAWRVWEEALAADPDHDYLLRVMGRHRFSRSDAQP
jgi:tetratricopeptide (TPR) repeat protein